MPGPRAKVRPEIADSERQHSGALTMADDTVRILCPNLNCRKVLAVPKTARGKTVRCKGCQMNIRVPSLVVAPVAPPTADAAPAQPAAKR